MICPFVLYSYYSFESIRRVFNETLGFTFQRKSASYAAGKVHALKCRIPNLTVRGVAVVTRFSVTHPDKKTQNTHKFGFAKIPEMLLNSV